MASCAYCGSTIFLGGNREGDLRFCNNDCQARGQLKRVADALPADQVRKYIDDVHAGDCPECKGPGPVDVHTSYRVWSALVVTQWASRPQVSCKGCGVKAKLGNAAYSFFLGWWGFPWGLIMTPVQVVRNLGGVFMSPDPSRPSDKLENILRLHLAAQATSSVPEARR